MALASILYVDGSLRPTTIDKAIAAHNALTGLTEPSEAQAEWLCTIRRIFIPPSHRPANYDPVYGYSKHSEPVENKLFHEGIEQGSYQGLPVNDR